jgi:hypothetical protein
VRCDASVGKHAHPHRVGVGEHADRVLAELDQLHVGDLGHEERRAEPSAQRGGLGHQRSVASGTGQAAGARHRLLEGIVAQGPRSGTPSPSQASARLDDVGMWVSVEKIDHLLVPGPGRLVRQRNHVAPCGLGQVLGRVRFRARQLPVAGELVELLGTAGFQRFGDAAVHPCSSARTQLVEQRVANDRMDETEPVDAEFDDDAGASNVLEQIQHVVGLLAADIGDEVDIERRAR